MFADYFKRFVTDMKHLPELCDVHEMFSDEEFKKVFRAFMTAEFFSTKGDIAIDGGAFDGATSADFAR